MNGDLPIPWLTNADLWNAPVEQSVSETDTRSLIHGAMTRFFR